MPDAPQAWAFLRNSDQIASTEQVEAAVRRVAGEIEVKLGGSYPLVLAVMGGAVVFAGQLLPMLRFPLDFDYIHASRYGTATRGSTTARDTPSPITRSPPDSRSSSSIPHASSRRFFPPSCPLWTRASMSAPASTAKATPSNS